LAGVNGVDIRKASRVCPFSDESPDEDRLAERRFDVDSMPYVQRLGYVRRVGVGRRVGEADLLESSSGGLTSWLIERLIDSDRVRGAIVVSAGSGDDLFEYVGPAGADEVRRARKSRYYPTPLSKVSTVLRASPGPYVLVGIPCMVRAARTLLEAEGSGSVAIKYYVGLVCGHMKNRYFAEALSWQAGVHPRDLHTIDFRVKNSARPASDYDYSATSKGGEVVTKRSSEALGTNWGHAAFQPNACNYCDDVYAETADIAFGDAWLPEYTSEWRGTNVVVSRNAELDELIDEGVAAGEIWFEQVEPERALEAQSGAFRHRVDGMRVRLADDIDAGLSVPAKRYGPGREHVSKRRVALIRLRRQLSATSTDAFIRARETDDLLEFTRPMKAASTQYARLERRLLARLLRGGGRRVKRAVRRFRRVA